MKANTPELMKFKKLQRKLGESRRGTIGLLEGLWIEVARNSPAGDIGKFTNEEIAIMVDWDGDPDLLVDSLVECKWLDRCSENRLVVHDWKDHCPTYVKGGLAKQRRDIAIASTSEVQAIASPAEDPASTFEVVSTKPSQAKPSQAKPNQVNKADFSLCPESVDPQLWKDWIAVRKTKHKTGPPTKTTMARVESEAAKAGITLNDAVRIAAEKEWQGFEACWLLGRDSQATKPKVEKAEGAFF